MSHLSVVQSNTHLILKHGYIEQCHFQKVTIKDYRFPRYSPQVNKALLFIDRSNVRIHNLTTNYNNFGWYVIYVVDHSNLIARDIWIQSNEISQYALRFSDSYNYSITRLLFENNVLRKGFQQSNHGNSLKYSDIIIQNNTNFKVGYFNQVFMLLPQDNLLVHLE